MSQNKELLSKGKEIQGKLQKMPEQYKLAVAVILSLFIVFFVAFSLYFLNQFLKEAILLRSR